MSWIKALWWRFKLWVAGYSKWSRCWLGQHLWDEPGGHCVKCLKCDEFLGRHEVCRRRTDLRRELDEMERE